MLSASSGIALMLFSIAIQSAPDERLFEAAKTGDLAGVDAALAAGASVDVLGQQGETALSAAVFEDDVDVVRKLLEAGARPDRERPGGRTALMSLRENAEICELLLEAGARVNATDERGRTPLLWVADFGSVQVIECLLGAGAEVDTRDDDGKTPLLEAARNNTVEVVAMLLDAGADVHQTSHGYTTLMLAATNDNEGVVARLLEAGARADARAEDGYTALEAAAGRWPGASDTVNLLLAAGARIDSTRANDLLFRAIRGGEAELVRMFLRAGADPNARRAYRTPEGEDSEPAIAAAASGGDERGDVLRALIQAGADVDAPTRLEKDRALGIVAEHGMADRVRILLEAGAAPDARDKKGETALMTAALYRPRWAWGEPKEPDFTETMKLLVNAGADVNAQGPMGQTPLLAAVGSGLLAHVELLLEAGADPKARLKTGESVLELAERYATEDIARAIEKAISNRAR